MGYRTPLDCPVNGLIVGADILSIRVIICIDNGKDDVPQLDVIILWISVVFRQQPDIRDPARHSAELMITPINGGDHHYDIGIIYHDHHVVNADEDDGDAGDGDGSASVEIDVWLIRRDPLLSCHTLVTPPLAVLTKFWPLPMSHGHMSPDQDGDDDCDNGDKNDENWEFPVK